MIFKYQEGQMILDIKLTCIMKFSDHLPHQNMSHNKSHKINKITKQSFNKYCLIFDLQDGNSNKSHLKK